MKRIAFRLARRYSSETRRTRSVSNFTISFCWASVACVFVVICSWSRVSFSSFAMFLSWIGRRISCGM